jgi:hypothetical protein
MMATIAIPNAIQRTGSNPDRPAQANTISMPASRNIPTNWTTVYITANPMLDTACSICDFRGMFEIVSECSRGQSGMSNAAAKRRKKVAWRRQPQVESQIIFEPRSGGRIDDVPIQTSRRTNNTNVSAAATRLGVYGKSPLELTPPSYFMSSLRDWGLVVVSAARIGVPHSGQRSLLARRS